MRNPLRKITAVFVLISLLPIGFIVYELSSLNKNEVIVREIYQDQLDAILYSVNQYTDDVVSSWANRFSIQVSGIKTVAGDTLSRKGIINLLGQINPVRYIYFTDLNNRSSMYGAARENAHYENELQTALDKLVEQNRDRIERLITYHNAGFKKMEPVDTTIAGNYLPVFFVINDDDKYSLGIMAIDLPVFIEQILAPKMQTISQEKFIISAFRESNDSVVYSTTVMDETSLPAASIRQRSSSDEQREDFWLLPGYYLGISLKGATIDDLVRDRITTSLVILVMLLMVLITGIIFLYRNISREIALSQAKSEFVSNVSHEIRTPLSLISMYAETLEMDRISEQKKKEYYSVIAKETARLSGIVNRILNFSHLESNKKKYESKSILLNDLCNEVLASYSLHLKEKGFTYDFVKEENLEMIYGDKASIAEAVINLVDNAVKYSRETKHIVLKTGNEQKFCFIEVKDEGIGIAKNHQPEIFDQFYRAPISDVHDTKGSGLGLTLVKKTVEAHHGKIKVESALGKGSTFRLYFPVKNGTAS
jgi:two-component system phosphate regulon sensor histidine kinase PhoR